MNKVRVFSLAHRPNVRSPWLVKWRVDGRSRTRAFRTKAEAELYRSRLMTAAGALERFDPVNGEPVSWAHSAVTYAEAAQTHVARKWTRWSASSRRSYIDAAAVTVAFLTSPKAKNRPDRETLSTAIRNHFLPPEGSRVGEPTDAEENALAWLQRASIPIADVTVDQIDTALDKASRKLDGSRAATNTLNRRRAAMNAVFEHAIRRGLITTNPVTRSDWEPETPSIEVDPKAVMSPVQCRAAQTHLATLGPVGEQLSVIVGVLWLSGLRPSEACNLTVGNLTLPEAGWGRITATGASVQVGARWTDTGERNDKKGLKWRRGGETREVPIPQELVAQLRQYIADKGLTSKDHLFTGVNGNTLSLSTMDDYWRRTRTHLFPSTDRLSRIPMSYLRHTNATILLQAGLPATEVARRLGHSPDVCLRIYSGFMRGFEDQANARVDIILES